MTIANGDPKKKPTKDHAV